MTYTTATITSPTPAKDLMAALNAPLTAGGFTFVETYGTPPNASWSAVCSGGGQYVAVAQSSATAATSPDGITWTQRSLPAVAAWSSVTYGGGMFVAVATSTTNVAASSPDGVTWTLRAMPAIGNWTAVTYGGGQFVAVVSGTAIAATSPDGITWTQRTMATANSWDAITYAAGQFVAVAQSAVYNTSPDGINWTARTAVPNSYAAGVAYGGSVFVAVHGVGSVATFASSSPDGITWTSRTMPSSQSWTGVAYGAGLFVAVATNNGGAATSPDGITWTARAMPASTNGYLAVTYSNGLFVAVGASGVSAATSPDGITWTARTMSTTSASAIADVWKSPAASNQFGQDWYLILKRVGDFGTSLYYQVAEGYTAATHRASAFGGTGVNVVPAAGTAANSLPPVAPELAAPASALVLLTAANPFTYWVSANANRVVLGVKTSNEQGFYAGLYDDLLPAGVTQFPLVCAQLPSNVVAAGAIGGGGSPAGNGGFTREPGQTLPSALNFEARIHNGFMVSTGGVMPGNFTPATDAYAVYGNVFSVSRVLLGTARPTATGNIANATRGLLIGCVSSVALTVIGDTVTSGGKTYVRMCGPSSGYGVFADTAL